MIWCRSSRESAFSALRTRSVAYRSHALVHRCSWWSLQCQCRSPWRPSITPSPSCSTRASGGQRYWRESPQLGLSNYNAEKSSALPASKGYVVIHSIWTWHGSLRRERTFLLCRELRSGNKIDATELRLEDGLFKSFDEIIRRQLDAVWHTVSYKTKQVGHLHPARRSW